jgi:hypothetical protein
MISTTFFDCEGNPVAYTDDQKAIYLFDGQPAAYFVKDSIYTFNGKHLGRFEKGWVRDSEGRCALFTKNASSFGPTKPVTKTEPMKWTKKSIPTPKVRETAPAHPFDKLAWSKLSGPQFFTSAPPTSQKALERSHPLMLWHRL